MRKRLAYVYKEYFNDKERRGLGLDAESGHPWVVWILTAAIAVAAIFVCIAI